MEHSFQQNMLKNSGSRNAHLGGNSGGSGLNQSQKVVSSSIEDKVKERGLKAKLKTKDNNANVNFSVANANNNGA